MGKNGVNINRLEGGLGRKNATADGVCLIVIQGAFATGSLALKVAKEILSVNDAEALGVTAAYDDANDILAHHHVDEFFRVNPNGNLFVVLDDNTLTDVELKTILKTNSEVKAVGFVRNAAAAPADMEAYVLSKQAVVNDLREESRNVSAVLVEGGVFDNATLIAAYEDLRGYGAANVSVVIGQDPIIRGLKAAHETYAAIGTALGAISVRNVNENIGSLDIENKPNEFKGDRTYPLTNTLRQRWLNAVLQDGKEVNSLTKQEYKALDDKGYIYVVPYNGFAGFYFSDSHTCTASSSDYSRIENNRVWDKGADLVRQALLPRVKSNLLTDPDTGNIREIEAAELETIGNKALDSMVASQEISGRDVYVNPKQNLSDGNALNVTGLMVFNNIVHNIDFDLGLTNKLQ